MALSLQTLFNFTETQFRLKLIAGKNGLNKTVSWVYYTEDPSTIEFIRGGELAITTGLLIERWKDNNRTADPDGTETFLKALIDAFVSHNASGLIVNTGKYITSIPQSIIDYCNEKSFSLFTMPWEIHTVDLMQDIGNMISSDSQNNNSMEKFFFKSIFEKDKFNPKQIESTSFFDAKTFTVVLLEFDKTLFNKDMEQLKRYVQFTFNPRLSVAQTAFVSFIHDHKIIFIVKDNIQAFSKSIFLTARSDNYFKTSTISVSDTCTSVEELEDAYNHAKIAMELTEDKTTLCKYDNLGIYKILTEVKNKKVLEQLYDSVLSKLNEFEEAKRADYLKTLQLFLKLGGNVQEVSEQNHTHRNTVLYRLGKIEETLDIDLKDGDTRCLLQTALYIKNLLGK